MSQLRAFAASNADGRKLALDFDAKQVPSISGLFVDAAFGDAFQTHTHQAGDDRSPEYRCRILAFDATQVPKQVPNISGLFVDAPSLMHSTHQADDGRTLTDSSSDATATSTAVVAVAEPVRVRVTKSLRLRGEARYVLEGALRRCQ